MGGGNLMKLADMARMAGLTAGAEVMAKMARPQDIIFNPELDIFEINDGLVDTLAADMRDHGFDKSQPLTVWKGEGCVVDGRTRLRAALAAGLAEIPVVEKEFTGLEEAVRYAYRRQAERRNLSQGEIFEAAVRLGIKDKRDGTGRKGENLAKDLGVSQSTIVHARTVAKRGTEDDLAAIKRGERTINEVYQNIRERKLKPKETAALSTVGVIDGDDFEVKNRNEEGNVPSIQGEESGGLIDPLGGEDTGTLEGKGVTGYRESPAGMELAETESAEDIKTGTIDITTEESRMAHSDAPDTAITRAAEEEADSEAEADKSGQTADCADIGDSLHIKFLRAAVILLCENRQGGSANLLINHFILQEKRPLFIRILPKETRNMIENTGPDSNRE
jgi:ParB-like chromosome segregation protein Spo0J